MQRDYFNHLNMAMYGVLVVEIFEINTTFDSNIVKGLIWQSFRC